MFPPAYQDAARKLGVTLPTLTQDPVLAVAELREWQEGPLKAAWRTAARQHHPDRGGKKETFQELSHCYDMLRDLEIRTDPPDPPPPPPPPPEAEAVHKFMREFLRRERARLARERADLAREHAEAQQRLAEEMAAQEARLRAEQERLRATKREIAAAKRKLEAEARRLASAQAHAAVGELRESIQAQREALGLRPPPAPRPPKPEGLTTVGDLLTTALDLGSALGLDRLLGVEPQARKVRRALRR